MNLEIRADEEAPYDWNKNLLCSEMGTVYNTIEYSSYAKKWLNWHPIFLSILNPDGKVLSQTIIFETPTIFKGKKIPQTLNLISKKFQTIKWNFGPVIFSSDHKDIISKFFEYILKRGKKIDGSFHPFFNDTLSIPLNIKKWATFIIDLQKPIDEIKKNFDKKSVIKNIKRSQKRGVKVNEINDKTIRDYITLLNEYRIQNKTESYSEQQIIDFWNFLKPTGFKGYLAFKDKEVIGGITFSTFNGFINEWGIARSKKDLEEKLVFSFELYFRSSKKTNDFNRKF